MSEQEVDTQKEDSPKKKSPGEIQKSNLRIAIVYPSYCLSLLLFLTSEVYQPEEPSQTSRGSLFGLLW